MKIGIDSGHNLPCDGGAVGIMNENTITKEVGTKVIDKLTALGYKVTNCLPPAASSLNQSLQLRCTFANRDDVEGFVSIHANLGGGKGCEVWYKSQSGYNLGKPILDELVALGYFNRGMKKCGVDGPNLYVISNTNAPACLVELFFIDNAQDCAVYNPDSLANAIVKGLAGTCPTENKPSQMGSYRVITGCFNSKDDATSFANKLKSNGTTAYVVDASILK